MDTREFQALELAARSKITRTGAFYLVPSLASKGSHRVDYDATKCSCEDFELRALPCKHILAVRHVKGRNITPVPFPKTPEEVETIRPKRATYKQKWPAYNAAQTGEKWSFLSLLSDLCGTVEEPARTCRGRKPVPLADALFAAAYKVYSTVSGRRFTCDLKDAQERGYVATAPHYNSVFRVFEDPDVTPLLRSLVAQSAAPLAAVETSFAVDSSGFGTSRFVKWFDAKYGLERKKAEWVKVHVCVGAKTNVVTAVEIGDGHDSTMLKKLLEGTAERFTLGDVTADKAYNGRAAYELIEKMGGVPFIPFKAKQRPDKNGETWRRLFHFFELNRDEFLTHYHQRSNVESTFSMVKRKFGDSLRSKTPTALVNESLAKLLCHNVVVLVHEMHELGIAAQFGVAEPDDDTPAIIRFPGA